MNKHLGRFAVGLITSACAISTLLAPPARAAITEMTIAGVQLSNGFKTQGAQTTFVSEDPVFGDVSYLLQPASRAQFPSVGVNLPALSAEHLVSLGSFVDLFFQYDSANGPADSGLRYYLQDNNGFIHTASATSVPAQATSGDFAGYYVTVYADQFSPALNSSTGKKADTISVRYANNHAGAIYFYYPAVFGKNGFALSDFLTTNNTSFNN